MQSYRLTFLIFLILAVSRSHKLSLHRASSDSNLESLRWGVLYDRRVTMNPDDVADVACHCSVAALLRWLLRLLAR